MPVLSNPLKTENRSTLARFHTWVKERQARMLFRLAHPCRQNIDTHNLEKPHATSPAQRV